MTSPQEALRQAKDAINGLLNKRGYGCGEGSDYQVEQHNARANEKAMDAVKAIDAALSQQAAQEPQLVKVGDLRIGQDESRIPTFHWPGPYLPMGAHALYVLAAPAKPAEQEKAQACPNCGGSGRTWKCTCTPIWPGYVDSFSQQAPSTAAQERDV